MSDRTSTLTAVLVDAVSGPARKIQGEITGIGTTVGHVSSILQGIGQGIGQQVFFALSDGIRRVASAIPDLLDQGHSYLEQLHQIQLETGMTAEQTSTLVGAFRSLGVPTQDLDVLFARLGKNLGSNEGLFRSLGVATRDSNGDMLDAYTIVANLRRQVSAHGESLLSTAAAQELFGRSGFKIIEALQASDPEWQKAIDNVRRWGGVVDQATITNADKLGDTLASFWQGITDIGVNIAAAVDPFLRSFVDSFASFVQSHLNEIVNFAVGVVNTVTGFISGLFGITDALGVTSGAVESGNSRASRSTDTFGKTLKAAAGGADAFTKSIQAHIRAIDDQIHAMEQAAERRRAIQERGRLADSLAAAQAQLADLRGNAPFLGGLSSAEQALALQKHAQDVIDAENDVADKRAAIGDFEADQKDRAERELLSRQKQRLQDNLAAHKLADAAILDSGLRMGAGLDKGIGTVLGNLGIRTKEFAKTASASFQIGVDAGRAFIGILLGAETGPHIPGHPMERTGGVVGALGSIGRAFGGLIGAAGFVGDAIRFVEDGLNSLSRFLGDLASSIHNFFASVGQFFGPSFEDLFKQELHDRGVPGYAHGGVIPARAGGTVIRVGEGGEDEMVMPVSKAAQWGGPTVNIYNDFLSMPSDEQLRHLTNEVSSRIAFSLNHSPVTSRPSGSF